MILKFFGRFTDSGSAAVKEAVTSLVTGHSSGNGTGVRFFTALMTGNGSGLILIPVFLPKSGTGLTIGYGEKP